MPCIGLTQACLCRSYGMLDQGLAKAWDGASRVARRACTSEAWQHAEHGMVQETTAPQSGYQTSCSSACPTPPVLRRA